MEADFTLAQYNQYGGLGNLTLLEFNEEMKYVWHTSNGIIRKLAELSQQLSFGATGERWSRVLKLKWDYFPKKYYFLQTYVGYDEDSENENMFSYGLTTGFDWTKLKVSMGLTQKTRTYENGTTLKERLFSMDLSKTF